MSRSPSPRKQGLRLRTRGAAVTEQPRTRAVVNAARAAALDLDELVNVLTDQLRTSSGTAA
jgi:hypothetical protein